MGARSGDNKNQKFLASLRYLATGKTVRSDPPKEILMIKFFMKTFF